MYESPVNLIYHESERQIIQEQEQTILKAIIGYDVVINKEELIKAINYDRNQYSKGYKDGVNDILDKIRAEIKTMSGDIETIANVLEIIGKYKAESEEA